MKYTIALLVIYLLASCGASPVITPATPRVEADKPSLSLIQVPGIAHQVESITVFSTINHLKLTSENSAIQISQNKIANQYMLEIKNPNNLKSGLITTSIKVYDADIPNSPPILTVPTMIQYVSPNEFYATPNQIALTDAETPQAAEGKIEVQHPLGAVTAAVVGADNIQIDINPDRNDSNKTIISLKSLAAAPTNITSAKIIIQLKPVGFTAAATIEAELILLAKNSKNHAYQPTNPLIIRQGRHIAKDDGKLILTYPASGTLFRFTGKALTLTAAAYKNRSFLDIQIDNAPVNTIQTSQTPMSYTFEANNEAQLHTAKIWNRAEGAYGSSIISTLEIINGSIITPPPVPDRKLMFIGGSVTCGALVETAGPLCIKSDSTQNGRLAHPTIIGDTLNAQSHLVCAGGRGILNGDSSTPAMDALHYFDYALAEIDNTSIWDHSSYTPDAVIIALGNNDPLDDHEKFERAYETLLNKISSLYPSAEIILTEGPLINGERKIYLTSAIKNTIAKTKNRRIHSMYSEYYPPNECDVHPNPATHAAIAIELATKIRLIMGWPNRLEQ